MGSWWHVQIGKRPVAVFGKNYVSDQLMLVFTDADHSLDRTKRDYLAHLDRLDEDQAEAALSIESDLMFSRVLEYSAPAGCLRTRLELQGFSTTRVQAMSTTFFDEELKEDVKNGVDLRDSWPEGRSSYPTGSSITYALTTSRGQSAVAGYPLNRDDPERRFLDSQWESLRDSFGDPRFALSLALTRTHASTIVTLDLTDLVLGGWLLADELPHQDARARIAATVAASGPVIVIAEGASDVRWLRRSLELAAPAAAHLFEFLDFAEYRTPGGTDRVVSLTKGMASAGVMNRIVAVLDNDTAGKAAAGQLEGLALPSRIVVTTLPEVAYAARYPTLGPAGLSMADVNGRAVSIEFMFGEEVLLGTDGVQFPVRWHSFIKSADDYQGRLESVDKTTVGQRIDEALCNSGGGGTSQQVLDGCQRLSSMLLTAAMPPDAAAAVWP